MSDENMDGRKIFLKSQKASNKNIISQNAILDMMCSNFTGEIYLFWTIWLSRIPSFLWNSMFQLLMDNVLIWMVAILIFERKQNDSISHKTSCYVCRVETIVLCLALFQKNHCGHLGFFVCLFVYNIFQIKGCCNQFEDSACFILVIV